MRDSIVIKKAYVGSKGRGEFTVRGGGHGGVSRSKYEVSVRGDPIGFAVLVFTSCHQSIELAQRPAKIDVHDAKA